MPLGHIGINVTDLGAAKAYYDVVMPLLGYETFIVADDEFAYRPVADKPGTYVFFYPATEPGDYSRHRNGLQHLAFIVKARDEVHAAYDAVVALGSLVLFAPSEFPEYHPGYYATFWQDPFGHMIEAVCHKAPKVT